jgi:hypothetical protein
VAGRRVTGAGIGSRIRCQIRESLRSGFVIPVTEIEMNHDSACALTSIIEGMIVAYIELHVYQAHRLDDHPRMRKTIIDLRTEMIEHLETAGFRRTQYDKMYEGAISIAERLQKRADAYADALKRLLCEFRSISEIPFGHHEALAWSGRLGVLLVQHGDSDICCDEHMEEKK